MGEVNVIVIDRRRKNLYLRYTDPITGQDHEKSSGTPKMREALKRAGEWQRELEANGHTSSRVTRWADFRQDFFENYVNHRSIGYSKNVSSTFNKLEEVMNPDQITRITTAWVKRFKTTVIREQYPPATVHKYMQHLKTAVKWAVEQGYLKSAPNYPAEKRHQAKGKKLMKGRPISQEEFERMLAAVPKCFPEFATATEEQTQQRAERIDSQKRLIRGLWLSGLRIGEALALTWDQWGDGIRIQVDSDGDLFLLIDGDDQKNGVSQMYPVVDEFAKFLLMTPPEHRTGHVFNPCGRLGIVSRRVDTVSDWIVQIGCKAGVKVDVKTSKAKRDSDKTIFASAHDLRRSFGARWAMIVEPMVLRDLMRHGSVQTTEKYYVGINAKRTLEHLRKRKQDSDRLNAQSERN